MNGKHLEQFTHRLAAGEPLKRALDVTGPVRARKSCQYCLLALNTNEFVYLD